LKEEALDRTPWSTRFGRDYGPVVRQTTEWMSIGQVFSVFSKTVYRCVTKNCSFMSDKTKLYNKAYMSLSSDAPWRCLKRIAETCRSVLYS
jgi:hypothetical protein